MTIQDIQITYADSIVRDRADGRTVVNLLRSLVSGDHTHHETRSAGSSALNGSVLLNTIPAA